MREFRGKVNLIYIDPPFDSKADYKKKIELRGKSAASDTSAFEEKQYGDIWTNDEYLQFMYERLILCRELLSDTGSIYVHCDWHRSHYLRNILDEVFGADNFRNEVIWHYQTYQGQVKNFFPRKHDTLLFATKSNTWTFKMQKDDQVEKTIDFTRWNQYLNENNEITGANYPQTDSRFDGYYRRFVNEHHRKPGPNDVILKLEGNTVDTVWDIKAVDPKNLEERLDYPTQKPEALLERIIKASSNPGDLVFDCFMGSGTTQAVAMKLGRRFLGADINLGAVQTTTKRLLNVAKELKSNVSLLASNVYYTSFDVYNVNDYDFFRNELEAKRLICDALGFEQLPDNNVYDAIDENGRKVCILGINRIATASEFGKIISNIDVREWQRKQQENPAEPVEKITFVCMGHDPDLKAQFENEVGKMGFKVDLEITDLLRDKKDLRLKRASDAKITLKDGKLIIENFFPMNLLQKLSIEKTDVADWKELCDSVMIDWNFDGVTFCPQVTDIPDKKELVKGEYKVPQNAGTIRVKITDLISESWEGNVNA